MTLDELLSFLQSKYPNWVSIDVIWTHFGRERNSKISDKLGQLERSNDAEVRDEKGQPRRWRAIK